MLASPLSPRIQVEATTEGARYLLGPRDVGPLRWLGLAPIAIGVALLLALGYAAFRLWGSLAPRLTPAERPPGPLPELPLPWPILLFAIVFGWLFIRAAFHAVRFGFFVLAGHGEILLAPGRLTVVERGGPFFRRERIRLDGIATLRVEDAFPGSAAPRSPAPSAAAPLAAVARLLALPASGKTRTLAIGYPASELEALAQDLARRLPSLALTSAGAVAAPPAVESTGWRGALPGPTDEAAPDPVGERRAADEAARDARLAESPPPGTTLEVSRAEGLEIRAPRVGLFRGSRGLGLFGLVWTLAAGAILIAVSTAEGNGDWPWLLTLLFPAVGLLILYFAARMGWRSTRIHFAPPLLRVERTTFGGSRIDEVRVDEIRGIGLGASGFKVNNRDVPELKLRLVTGTEIGLLIERRAEELDWLAALLRHELRLAGGGRGFPAD